MNFPKPGRSDEQIEAEKSLVTTFAHKSRISLRKELKYFRTRNGSFSMEVDGYSDKPAVLCEAWARIGEPKSAQRHKIINDALKLIFLEKKLGKVCRKVIIFADEKARQPFISPKSWVSACLKEFKIETELVKLPPNIRKGLIAAQKRQRR